MRKFGLHTNLEGLGVEVNDTLRGILHAIDEKLEAEIVSKQLLIDRLHLEAENLKFLISEKNSVIRELDLQLSNCKRKEEGRRQLINKLLNDCERLQQDIDWYKRTYVTRSVPGVFLEKIKRFFSGNNNSDLSEKF